MQKIITRETLKSFAYVNDNAVKTPIRGVIVRFMGLNWHGQFANDTLEGGFYGEKGLLFVVPYLDPWAWMNRTAVAITDEILDVVFAAYGLKEDTPICSTGGSMGGLAAVTYCRYAARTPVKCVADCPVLDAVYHFNERPDLPHSFYSALHSYDGTLEDALKSVSPLHLIGELPKIPYAILYCDEDKAVSPAHHAIPFTAAMREAEYDITLEGIAGRGHCDLGFAGKRAYAGQILSAFEG